MTPQPARRTMFRVIRERVDGKTVRILLEPVVPGTSVQECPEGEIELVTGVLRSNPWDYEPPAGPVGPAVSAPAPVMLPNRLRPYALQVGSIAGGLVGAWLMARGLWS